MKNIRTAAITRVAFHSGLVWSRLQAGLRNGQRALGLSLWLWLVLLAAGCAQAPKDQSHDADSFSFGKVVSVGAASLEIKEYDFSKEADVVSRYEINAQTEFGKVTNLTELQTGDDVVIDYLTEGNRRRVTTLVKEEKGGIPASPVIEHPGRLVIAPDFQQIGDVEDGGGVLRVMSSTAAMISTNPVEQARFNQQAQLPTMNSGETPTNINLSGIDKWLPSASDLPEAVHLCQRSAFAPWKLLVWDDELSGSSVALYLTNALQFAWQGHGMVTTGPRLPETAGETPETRFAGPPAGTDLDGDGVPDLLIYDYSGGAHCCSTVKHIVCSDPPVLTAQISGWHSEPEYQDLDGDGHYEMMLGDASYAYWNACYVASPSPRVIFRIHHGHYEMAGDLMRQRAPAAAQTAAGIQDLKRKLARYDAFCARGQTNQNADAKPTAEEEEDNDFFMGFAWRKDGVCISPAVWDLLLELIYTGQVDAAVKALDTMWPAGKPHKNAFANELFAMIRASWYGSHLPWFDELEQAFTSHFPPPAS